MPDLARSLGKFLYRDVFYIVAGFIIISSAAYLDKPVLPHLVGNDTVYALLATAFAYAVGLLNQEIWSQFPFVKTSTRKGYPAFLRGIYRRHMGYDWKHRPITTKEISDDPDFQRAVNLKQIGAALGTSFLTGAAFVFAASITHGSKSFAIEALVMAVAGALFILMSWLHNMRQASFMAKSREGNSTD
jgi:peptidoglycan/LPS O-acetylase OafA/YrhL